jgi:glutathione S-transferase
VGQPSWKSLARQKEIRNSLASGCRGWTLLSNSSGTLRRVHVSKQAGDGNAMVTHRVLSKMRGRNPIMKLYYMKGACSLASYISLNEAGIQFEAIEIDHESRKTACGEALDSINTKGYVPVLRLDNGEILTENVAVLQYIADRNPAAKLAPEPGTLQRYRLIELLGYINSEIHKNFGPLFDPSISNDVKSFATRNLSKRISWIDQALGSKTFLMGEQFTVADAYLYVVLTWTSHVGIDLGQWSALKRHNERVAARPHVIAARKAEGL